MRRTLGLLPEDDGTGVRVAKIGRFASAEGLLKEVSTREYPMSTRECQRMADDSQDDVVLEIDGVTIGSDQTVALRRLERIEFQYLISSKTTDHVCTVTIIRRGVRQVVHIPLKPELSLIPVSTSSPNCAPSYLIVGGLVFVPLSRPWIVSSKKNALVLQQVRLPPLLPLWAHIGVGILHIHARARTHTHTHTHTYTAHKRLGVGRHAAAASVGKGF
jgi:hypothetical protein